jgi:exodeoxyribonuclease V gamma subunit
VSIACESCGYLLTGTISSIWPGTLLHYRSATVKATDRLRIWIQHLLCSAADAAAPDASILIGTDCVWETGTLRAIARQELEKLVTLYDRGLSSVLHFFPKSSLDYADALNRGKAPHDAMRAAHNAWAGNDYAPGENTDPYYTLCFRGHDPLDAEFETLSREIFDPLITYQKKAAR